ncbi:MAG: hypothetical protein E7260_13040 [Lachnospiraceae bacterium]|nr:hypothetical protein [Lachnospiraceae bacterium]
MYIEINLKSELAFYNLEGKWNDYIGIQKSVINTLKATRFFDNNVVKNEISNMFIRINPKGIKETLGSSKRFQTLPRKLKELKIATLRSLPDIIRHGVLTEDNVPNTHRNNSLFAYITNNIKIDEYTYQVRVSIKKKVGSNIFWIHNIDCK